MVCRTSRPACQASPTAVVSGAAVSITKRNAQTTVVVQDQQTVVIGGIRDLYTRLSGKADAPAAPEDAAPDPGITALEEQRVAAARVARQPGAPAILEELYDTRQGGGVKTRVTISWAASWPWSMPRSCRM